MLENAIENFLDQLKSERDFDAPFLALLRVHDYSDIHFLHGAYEYGKDFIAKKQNEQGSITQFTFQSKFGGIDKTTWESEVQPQCEAMTYASIGHPSLDKTLPRKPVVVFTGTFKGQAATLAEQYNQNRLSRGIPEVEFWDREQLIEKLTADVCLGKHSDWTVLGQLVQELERGSRSIHAIEEFCRHWTQPADIQSLWRKVLEICIVRDELRRRGLELYAFRLILAVLRMACVLHSKKCISDLDFQQIIDIVAREIINFADRILAPFIEMDKSGTLEDLFELTNASELISTGPRILMQMEIVSLDLFLRPQLTEIELAVRKQFFNFIISIEATNKLISDNYAVSILVMVLACHRLDLDYEHWLIRVITWIANSYDAGKLGLAPVWATPADEIARLLLSHSSNPFGPRINTSMAASTTLDVCSIIGNVRLYNDAHNEFLAVELIPARIVPIETPKEYIPNAGGCLSTLTNDYAETWLGKDGWKNSTCHNEADQPRPFDLSANSWVGLALSILIRDRWWLHSLRILATTA